MRRMNAAYLAEETQGCLLCLVDLHPNSLSVDGGVGGLSLDSKFAKLRDELSNLLLFGLIDLVLELVHSYKKVENPV